MNKVHVVAGPTGAGKTSFATKLAEQIGGELINVDSRQIYMYLDIGTNKGKLNKVADRTCWDYPRFSVEDSKAILNLVSFLEPDVTFDAFSFRDLVYELIEILLSESITPILVGGSGLYLQAILHPNDYSVADTADPELREQLNNKTVEELQQILGDALHQLNDSDRQNPRRLIRAIEKANTQDDEAYSVKEYPVYKFEKHYIEPNQDNLEKNLRIRAEEMVNEGIVEEVQSLLENGYSKKIPVLQGIGYKQVLDYLDGEVQKSDLAEQICIAHRQYAKRQKTWFRKYFYK